MRSEFELIPDESRALFTADVIRVFEKLKGKTVIVLKLNENIGSSRWVLNTWKKVNEIVVPIAQAFGHHIVNMNELVLSVDDLATPDDAGGHYNREVYIKLAAYVSEICLMKSVNAE